MHMVAVQCSAVQCSVAQCMGTHRFGYRHGRGCVLRRDPAGAVVRSLHNVGGCRGHVGGYRGYVWVRAATRVYCRPIDGNIRFIYMKYI